MRKRFCKVAGMGSALTAMLFGPAVTRAQVSVGLPANFAGLSSQDLVTTVGNIVQIVLGFLGVLAVLLILYGGLIWMTSAGQEEKIAKAKKVIISAVIGLLAILVSYALAVFIIRSLQQAVGPGAGGPGGGPGGGFGFALGAGILESHYPARNARDIPRNTNIFITFKEPLNPATVCTAGKVNVNGVEIRDANDLVAADANDSDNDNLLEGVDCSTGDNLTFRFDPPELLGLANGDTVYQVILTASILKANGDSALGALGYEWQFTVGSVVDETPPEVTSVYPASGQTAVRNSLVQINFSEAVDPTTASGITPPYSNISMEAPSVVDGSYAAGNQYQTTEFTSNALCGVNSCGGNVYCLPGPASVTGTVSTAITDMAGNALAQVFSWTFSTSDQLDLAPPVMTARAPINNAVDVDLQEPLTAPFNERLSAGSINTDNVGLSRSGFDDQINYWTGKQEMDSNGDGINDFTQVIIYHDTLTPLRPYHPGIDSGLLDINQNCYYPAGCDVNGDGQGSAAECLPPNF